SPTHEVAGLVDGRWLRPSTFSLPAVGDAPAKRYTGPLGAAVPIDYLLELLKRNSVTWSTAPSTNPPPETPVAKSNQHFSPCVKKDREFAVLALAFPNCHEDCATGKFPGISIHNRCNRRADLEAALTWRSDH